MKEYKFNAFNELTTPDSWVEKALAIPEEEEKRRPAVTARRIRYAALAASVVLVGTLAVILFANRDSQPPAAVAPTVAATVSVSTEPAAEKPTVKAASPTIPTEKPTQPASSAPTQPATQSVTTAPQTVADDDTQAQPVSPQSSGATPSPTQPPTAPPAPTQQPTTPPTEPPTEAPGYKDVDLAAVGYDGIIIEKIPLDDVAEDSVIYCRISTGDGELLGDSDLYSEEHLARRIDRDGVVTVYYLPCDCVTLPYAGTYRFEFYDETGRILYTGDEYLIPD